MWVNTHSRRALQVGRGLWDLPESEPAYGVFSYENYWTYNPQQQSIPLLIIFMIRGKGSALSRRKSHLKIQTQQFFRFGLPNAFTKFMIIFMKPHL